MKKYVKCQSCGNTEKVIDRDLGLSSLYGLTYPFWWLLYFICWLTRHNFYEICQLTAYSPCHICFRRLCEQHSPCPCGCIERAKARYSC